MKKIIFYGLMLLISQHLQSSLDLVSVDPSSYHQRPPIYHNQPPQEVPFLGQERPQVYGTSNYSETNIVSEPDTVIVGVPVHPYDYLISPSPLTSNGDGTNDRAQSNSERTCRKVTLIFLGGITLCSMAALTTMYSTHLARHGF